MNARQLLICGAIAGPLFTIVALAQAFARPGFDLSRAQLSLLSNGDLGWIQVGNFLVTGALFIAGALGLARAASVPNTWASRPIAIFGATQIAAGAFGADPAFGFPPGTPAGPPAVFTWHAGLHLLAAVVGLFAIAVAGVSFGQWFGRSGRPGWSLWSYVAGAAMVVGLVANIAMGGQPATTIAFTGAALHAFLWASAIHARFALRGGPAESAA